MTNLEASTGHRRTDVRTERRNPAPGRASAAHWPYLVPIRPGRGRRRRTGHRGHGRDTAPISAGIPSKVAVSIGPGLIRLTRIPPGQLGGPGAGEGP